MASKLSKKNKIIIITCSVIVGVIALIILFSFTLFAVRKVSVDYRSSTVNLSVTQAEIIESSGIKKGGSVFFQNKSKYADNLEKKYPYIKVVNIETVFPSKIVIHVVERNEVYAVKLGEQYYICDNEFKILRITDTFESEQDNAILLSGVEVKEANYAECDKLVVSNYADIYDKLYENNRTLDEQRAIIKEIKFYEEDEVEGYNKKILAAELKLFNGQVFKIRDCNTLLSSKTKLFIDLYSQQFNFIGKTVKLKDNSEVVVTEELLFNSVIEISHYYDFDSNKGDCGFTIIPNN